MDTLSASVSSLNLPSLPPPPQPPLRSISSRFKSTVNATTSASSTNLSKPTSSSPSSASYSQNRNPNFLKAISFHLPQTKPSRVVTPPPPPVHDKAASGFAAALVSVCQSKNCLGRTQEDVRRLMEFLVGEEKKRNKVLVNDVVERGKFGKHFKGLVKMLIARGKSGILVDVLMEFERICNELVSKKLVWVS
ncbi:ATPase, F1 complex, OSCP/delta subunit protein [Arabidopsis thaliana]|uniref:ATPase, F1 complex, OSCP/delta subunit protein n=1 Tax=Arabidopsis thaliana TaxID=3702 RepID=Q8W481_ARATH|nr:ATPase, F1 complex, OSCP/delta subunit protein [Arabidopsis thaliana]AAL32856.1 Unknown protein [Arabidopsis thaliana]AAM10210.1 unknown protein [Arabidopsis thaliana]AAM61086.1 unknown [Arabidopsis thaliana]AEE81952.1 ATPase, F1 complex, OSCP/delta subunit protein [Arabidopsis thaliana]|eukprot:NP_567198.1 ATPase, F1 complex, OSCP/delta subunit protein [Arabidopsis thaliana]